MKNDVKKRLEWVKLYETIGNVDILEQADPSKLN